MTLNRVVVTGYGVTSPIGNTPEEFWNSLYDGRIGIGPITKFDTSDIPVHNAGEVKDFPFDKYFVRKDKNRMDMYSIYAIYATLEALENAGLDMETENRDRVGVIVSSGIGGLQEMQEQIIRMHEKGIRRIQPMFIPKALSNMAAGNIALKIGAQGVCKSITTACASSNDAIGEAFREIKFGFHDVILAGGSESTINEIGIGGFNALTALSTTEDPKRAAIPFDKDRNGFVMGAGAVLVLESLEHAQNRGATILAEAVVMVAIVMPTHQLPQHQMVLAQLKAIKLAIQEAGIQASDVDYVNAHGTSTQANEKEKVKLSLLYLVKTFQFLQPSPSLGIFWGAAGAVEAIATIEAIRHSFIPMTAGTKELSDDIEANVIFGQGQEADLQYAISNTFGFGGHNSVLAFKRWEE